jgi:hypothetical protein
MNLRSALKIACILFVFHLGTACLGQEVDTWDNQLFVGNKVGWGKNKWRTTGEMQFRVKDNMRALDRWFLEGIGSYLATENWEVAIPIRYSIRPENNEFRPGVSVFYKLRPQDNIQITQQVMYQTDISSVEVQHGARYVAFYNQKINDHWIPNGAAGIFYRWSDGFNGLQFIRLGAGVSYIVSERHTLNLSYFLGITNDGMNWTYQGIPFIQLVFNLGGEFEHLPAKYINF